MVQVALAMIPMGTVIEIGFSPFSTNIGGHPIKKSDVVHEDVGKPRLN